MNVLDTIAIGYSTTRNIFFEKWDAIPQLFNGEMLLNLNNGGIVLYLNDKIS